MSWPKFWSKKSPLSLALWPLSGIYAALFAWQKQKKLRLRRPFSVPVIVVGNITVGGTGKTPMILYLLEQLQKMGYHPGVISRGYGAKVDIAPLQVRHVQPKLYGDEPSLIHQRFPEVPVVIHPNRPKALQFLRKLAPDVDVVLSDDGLQHWALDRAMEIVMVDGQRGLGNGFLLPAGPLRESPQHLEKVDCVFYTQSRPGEQRGQVYLKPRSWVNLATGEEKNLEAFVGQKAYAIAGIGNPERFWHTLQSLGIAAKTYAFADHYVYKKADLAHFTHDMPLLMTEKDGVKLKAMAQDNWWQLRVDLVLNPADEAELLAKIGTQIPKKEKAYA